MAANPNLKLKLLYIMKILLEKTDENHKLTVNDIIIELEKYDITAERKSIYSDIEILKVFGMDILCERSRANQYYVASREFELPELKLLVDAVQSSKFITHKKSQELINKIGKLTSVHQAKELDRQVLVDRRVKTMNESIYYNVDILHRAIQQNKQVQFKYFKYTVDKKMKLRRDGEIYNASPYALSWSNENYYLIAYYDRYDSISNFRVDRMINVELTDQDRILVDKAKDFNIADYSKKIFNMFSGKTQKVELEFDNSLINVVIDRFGQDVFINKKTKRTFCIKVDVVVSRTFLGWLFMFKDKVKIISPNHLKELMTNAAKAVLCLYS